MNTDNQPMPDDGYRNAWQQAFDKADDTPPPRVWNAIERQLDADNRARVIPLWAHVRPWATGIAATVAFMLIGWWLITSETATPTIAHNSMSAPQLASTKSRLPIEVGSQLEANARVAHHKKGLTAQTGTGMAPSSLPTQRGPSDQTRITASTTANQPVNNQNRVGDLPVNSRINPIKSQPESRPPGISGQPGLALAAFGQPRQLNAAILTSDPLLTTETVHFVTALKPLSGKGFRNNALTTRRAVWFPDSEPATETVGGQPSKTAKRETWASLSVMPASFSPAVSLPDQVLSGNSLPNTYAVTGVYAPVNNPAVRTESGAAVAVQLSVGTQVHDRWSFETGLGYMQATSTIVSPAQVTPVATGTTDDLTLYTALLQNAVNRSAALANDKAYTVQSALYDTQSQGRTRNDYRYVQVPVQVGYQLRPRRKLGLTVLGGLLTNWFVRNSVGESLVVKPSDNVYRSLTLAGMAGARLRYRTARRWSASLAGVYQQSLQSGTRSDAGLVTHPHTVGVSFSMDYHF